MNDAIVSGYFCNREQTFEIFMRDKCPVDKSLRRNKKHDLFIIFICLKLSFSSGESLVDNPLVFFHSANSEPAISLDSP